jgi:hypothetical protein
VIFYVPSLGIFECTVVKKYFCDLRLGGIGIGLGTPKGEQFGLTIGSVWNASLEY